MTSNKIKKSLKRLLPTPVFELIQRLRKIGYQPPAEISALREEFMKCQPSDPEQMALRHGITVSVHPESREPFEWFCYRSPEMVREFDSFIHHARSFKTFADVGANHGVFSLAFMRLQPNGRVLSVDPSPVAFDILLFNKSRNALERMVACNVACGDSEGHISMQPNWHHLEVVTHSTPTNNAVSVRMVPLDTLCAEHGIYPEILKIDVEGFELAVLRGAERALSTAKVLFLEVHPERIEEIKSSQEEVFEFLAQRGWEMSTLAGVAVTRQDFVDRIHTFWTVCTKANASK